MPNNPIGKVPLEEEVSAEIAATAEVRAEMIKEVGEEMKMPI